MSFFLSVQIDTVHSVGATIVRKGVSHFTLTDEKVKKILPQSELGLFQVLEKVQVAAMIVE